MIELGCAHVVHVGLGQHRDEHRDPSEPNPTRLRKALCFIIVCRAMGMLYNIMCLRMSSDEAYTIYRRLIQKNNLLSEDYYRNLRKTNGYIEKR